MPDSLDFAPDESVIKDSVAQLIQPYAELKKTFFLNASKIEDETAQENAGKSYGPLIEYLYLLLDFSKPDNLNILDKIEEAQTQLEYLDTKIHVTDDDIRELKKLCSWVDTGPLSPHLKTQPPILDL